MRSLTLLAAAIFMSFPAVSIRDRFEEHSRIETAGNGTKHSALPEVHYTLTISDRDTTGWSVTMDVRGAREKFVVALAKHPEYDDRYFRYIRDVRASSGTITRRDSTRWTVTAPKGATTISYRIEPPPSPSPRSAWRPHISSTGALTGGPHSFLYIEGAEHAPVCVTLSAPTNWAVATALTPTADQRRFCAANVSELVESPILLGRLNQWHFDVGGVPHTVAYWPLPNSQPFDTAAFVNGFQRLARQAIQLFGGAPYRHYVFQMQDNAFSGGLEHPASMTMGAMSSELAKDPYFVIGEVAHEFVHTWNMMAIRPAEYTGVSWKQIRPVPTLWFGEGATIYYADLLRRRAGLPMAAPDSNRALHLERAIARYVNQPGNTRFSAVQISNVAYNARPDALGDYDASVHLTGEVFSTMLDWLIRDATNGERSLDDVMRLLYQQSKDPTYRGIGNAHLERAVADICGCAARVHDFFEYNVRSAHPMNFDKYLALAGLRAVVATVPAVTINDQRIPDLRLFSWIPPGDSTLSLLLSNPATAFGRAGLHSGDKLLRVNDSLVTTQQGLRQALNRARIGDTLRLLVQGKAGGSTLTVSVPVVGYERSVVRIEPLPSATPRQIRVREAWLAAGIDTRH